MFTKNEHFIDFYSKIHRTPKRFLRLLSGALLLGALGLQCTELGLTKSKDPDLSNEAASLLALLSVNNASLAAGAASCPEGASVPAGVYLADTVTSAPAHTGTDFKNAAKATNGICGGGSDSGGTDVFSLDATGSGATIVLEWASKRVTNGTGIDFVVFENPFNISGSSTNRFMDLVVVEVSEDNSTYCGFAPDYTNAPETTYSRDPSKWSNFAGKTPVLYNQATNPLSAADIFDPAKGGGDGFDLSNLSSANQFGNGCSATARNNLQTNGFVYLRLRSASALTNPDTGAAFVADSISNGADIDGVLARYTAAR